MLRLQSLARHSADAGCALRANARGCKLRLLIGQVCLLLELRLLHCELVCRLHVACARRLLTGSRGLRRLLIESLSLCALADVKLSCALRLTERLL